MNFAASFLPKHQACSRYPQKNRDNFNTKSSEVERFACPGKWVFAEMNQDPVYCDRKCYDGYNDYLESALDVRATVKYSIGVTGSFTSHRQSGIDVLPPAAVNTSVTDADQKCNRNSKLRNAEVKLEFRIVEDAHGSPNKDLETGNYLTYQLIQDAQLGRRESKKSNEG